MEYELVEHALTAEQRRIYDAYAGAFEVIHNNLNAALEATNTVGTGCAGGSRTLNAQAKAAARSAFESAKQRFFSHSISAMKTSTLIKCIERDVEAGHAAVVQLVSTGEALMERRLAEIPTEEWGDLLVDATPRDAILSYLSHSFPTQLFEEYTDSDGNLASRPVLRDGQPVQCREALERRDRLIEHLASLDPVPGALDQIVQHFGTEQAAEVTGRSRRIVAKLDGAGRRLAVESRAGLANLAETQAFQDDEKRILVFSDAGGTGRSYHADLGARNRRLRVHYLLEPGWKADTAGHWTDFSTAEHGDLLDLIARACRLHAFHDVLEEARRFLSLPQAERKASGMAHPPAPLGSPEAARRLFAAAKPIPGTLAAVYLRSRGIPNLYDLPALRFHPTCFYRAHEGAPRETWPALLAAVTDAEGVITGVLRTWLARDGSDKVPLATPRRSMGRLLGHGVRLGRAQPAPAQAGVLAAGEGLETMLSLRVALPALQR